LTRSTAFFGLHLSDEKIEQIIHHAAEGVGVRATARLLGLNKDTVNRVILRAGEHCQLVLSNLLRSLKLEETQLDELWAFVKKRKILAEVHAFKNIVV
jgi:IS30 family transposase